MNDDQILQGLEGSADDARLDADDIAARMRREQQETIADEAARDREARPGA